MIQYCRICVYRRKLLLARKQFLRCLSSHGNQEGEGGAGKGFDYKSKWNELKKEWSAASVKTPNTALGKVPKETDILIIGGGIVGSSVAYWIKQKSTRALDVTVVERDPGYTRASSMLSAGGIRQQFSLPENVQMSMYTSRFLQNIRRHLSVLDEDPPDVQFHHQGYLFLATPDRAQLLSDCVRMQREQGAKVELISKEKLALKYPWLNLENIEVGSYGIQGEGWFDPWLLVRALKKKNLSLGVNYIAGELTGFNFSPIVPGQSPDAVPDLEGANIRVESGEEFTTVFNTVVNCAGAWAAEVANMAGVGVGGDAFSIPLPVEPRKRFVFVVHCPKGPGLDCPFAVDPTGVYFRREGVGGYYICGASPDSLEDEPDVSNFDVDYDFYQNVVWPSLAYRVPCFECSKLKSAWAGYYDFNYVDQNLIIGRHPIHQNMIFANGMSGHGVQQAISIGRAVMELIIYGNYQTIDLTRFGFERFLTDQIIPERFIV